MSEENNINNQPPQFSEEELKMPEGMKPAVEEEHHGRLAIILVLLIVSLVCILGGLYLWYLNAFQQPMNEPLPQPERVVPEMPNEPEMENADASVQQLETVSTSNEIDAIEADLESTNLDELDAELQAIDAELEAALE